MSKLTVPNTMAPFTEKGQFRIIGHIEQAKNYQGAAVDLAASFLWMATFDGQIGDLFLELGTPPAAGEDMTVDVLKNGVSILSSTRDIISTDVKGRIDLFAKIDTTKYAFVEGDVFSVTRDYTAGGGPAPMKDTLVVLEPSLGRYHE